jgi:hypothetical protein
MWLLKEGGALGGSRTRHSVPRSRVGARAPLDEAFSPPPRAASSPLDLCLPIIEQHGADQDETERPDPSGNLPLRTGEAQLKPAGPTGGHSKDGQGNMAQFHEEFFLDVAQGMRVREQQSAPYGANRRKDQTGTSRNDAARPHTPLKNGESHDQQYEQTVLKYVCHGEALPEAPRPKRPILRIRPQEEKHS